MTPFLAMFSFYDGMSSGFEPPPEVVGHYGPALTERERIKWFGDDRSPAEKEKARKAYLKKRRIELGIIEDDEEEAVEPVKAKPIAKQKVNNERQIRERALQKAQEKQKTLLQAARDKEIADDLEEEEFVMWLFDQGD